MLSEQKHELIRIQEVDLDGTACLEISISSDLQENVWLDRQDGSIVQILITQPDGTREETRYRLVEKAEPGTDVLALLDRVVVP